MTAAIDAETRNVLGIGHVIATIPAVRTAMKAGDRDTLVVTLLDSLEATKRELGVLPGKSTLGSAEYKLAFGGTPVLRQQQLGGRDVATYLGQIRNFSGAPVAVLEIVADTKDFAAIEADTRFYLVLATLAVVLAAAVLGFFLARSLSKPVIALTGAMNALSAGNMNAEIPGSGRADEIGTMAKAVEVFKRSMIEADRLRVAQEGTKQRTEAEKKAISASRPIRSTRR